MHGAGRRKLHIQKVTVNNKLPVWVCVSMCVFVCMCEYVCEYVGVCMYVWVCVCGCMCGCVYKSPNQHIVTVLCGIWGVALGVR